jgi:hypothetical protein
MANCFNSEHTLLQSSLADDKILNQVNNEKNVVRVTVAILPFANW